MNEPDVILEGKMSSCRVQSEAQNNSKTTVSKPALSPQIGE